MQKTTFPVEVIIHDDASNDGTADIVRRYVDKYPALIKGVLQPKNLYSQGISRDRFIAPLLRGKYIAICEGDDYWLDALKLEKQAGALENNPNTDLSIHRAFRVDQKTNCESIMGQYAAETCVVPVGAIIKKEFGSIPTASSFLRNSALSELHDFRKSRPYLTVGDIYLHFFGAKRGGAYYIHDIMSAYRANAPGSWSARVYLVPEKRVKHISARVRSYYEIDKITGRIFSRDLMDSNISWSRQVVHSDDIGFAQKLRFAFAIFRYLRLRDGLIKVPAAFVRAYLLPKKHS